MRLFVVLVQPEVMLVLAAHLHAVYQHDHQLSHSLRLGNSYHDLGLFH